MKKVFSVLMIASVLCLTMLLFSNSGVAFAKDTTALQPLDSNCPGGFTVSNTTVSDLGHFFMCEKSNSPPAFATAVSAPCSAASNKVEAILIVLGNSQILDSASSRCGFVMTSYHPIATEHRVRSCTNITVAGRTISGCSDLVV